MSTSDFRGVAAICRSKRRLLVGFSVWLGLASGLAASLFGRVNHLETAELVWILFVAQLVLALLGPLAAAAGVTLTASPAGARSRRDELLALPIGRLALPTAFLLSGAAIALATFACFVGGFSVFVGSGRVLGALLSPPIPQEMSLGPLERAFVVLAVFLGVSSLASIAHDPCLAVGVFVVLGGTLGFLLPAVAGYREPEVAAFGGLFLLCLVAYALALPFVLYARPRHHWNVTRVPGKTTAAGPSGPAGPALLTTAAALVALGFLGAGKALACVLVLGAVQTLRAQRRQPPVERRGMSHLAVAHVVGLVFVAPPVVLGLVADARCYADAARPRPETVAYYAPSPDGRYLAACLRPYGAPGIVRAVVVDLSGKEPLRVLPPRSADLDMACAWSRDGRYVAVHELAVGRITIRTSAGGANLVFGAEVDGFDGLTARAGAMLVRGLQSTFILDTTTGELVEKPLLELAPGWTSPDELVHVAPHALGGCELADGRGHSAPWALPEFTIDAYDAEGAVVGGIRDPDRRSLERFRLGAGGLAAISSGSRWELASATPRPRAGADPRDPNKVLELRFARGETTRTVADCVLPFAYWIDETKVLLHQLGETCVLDLESGARRVVASSSKKEKAGWRSRPFTSASLARWRFADERPWLIVSAADGSSSIVDLRTGNATPLPTSPGFEPEWVAGTRAFGRGPGKELLVRDGAGAPRPVF